MVRLQRFLNRSKVVARTQIDAITPVAKDFDQHVRLLKSIKQQPVDVLLLGDSLTSYWPLHGQRSWSKLTPYRPFNLGVAGDRTEHLLWRITNGELDGINPKIVVILIGTNNIGQLNDERPEWIANAIEKIFEAVHEHLPNANVLLLGIFPRDAKDSVRRTKVVKVNSLIRGLNDGTKTRFLDLGRTFLDEGDNIPSDIMPDQVHLSEKGYEIWFEGMQPIMEEILKEKR
jgi:lysophospholipase L1-like esterase